MSPGSHEIIYFLPQIIFNNLLNMVGALFYDLNEINIGMTRLQCKQIISSFYLSHCCRTGQKYHSTVPLEQCR